MLSSLEERIWNLNSNGWYSTQMSSLQPLVVLCIAWKSQVSVYKVVNSLFMMRPIASLNLDLLNKSRKS